MQISPSLGVLRMTEGCLQEMCDVVFCGKMNMLFLVVIDEFYGLFTLKNTSLSIDFGGERGSPEVNTLLTVLGPPVYSVLLIFGWIKKVN